MTRLRPSFAYLFIIGVAVLALLSPGLSEESLAVEPETYKTAFAVGLVGVFLLFWLLTNPFNKATKIVKSNFYLPIIAFVLWNVVSFIWLIDIEAGLLATTQYLSMAIGFFLVLNLSYEDESYIKLLLKLLVIAGFLVSLLGLLQYYFPHSQDIQTFSRQAVRPAASFGNKNMSSQFLVLTLPISVVFLWRAHRLKNIIFYTTTSTVITWFLTHTYTRGGWVAVLTQAVFLAAFFVLDKIKKQGGNPVPADTKDKKFATRTIKNIIIVIGIIVYLIGINYNDEREFGNNKIADRAQSIITGDDSGRLPAWANTLNLIKYNWLIGVGSGNWEASYPPYYDSIIPDVIYNERVRLRRLHNSYLEIFSNTGTIGFAFLLWLLFLTVKAVSHILLNASHPQRYLVLSMALSLIGFSVSAMISFPLRVYLPGLIVLVYIGAIASIYAKTKRPNIKDKANYWYLSATTTKILIPILVLLAIVLAYLSYQWVQSKHYYQKSIEYRRAGYGQKSLELAIKSVDYNPYTARSLSILGEGLKNKNPRLAIDKLESSVKYNPNNSLVIIALSLVYHQLAINSLRQGLNDQANKALSRHHDTLKYLLKVDFRNVKGYLLLARYYLQTGQLDKAQQSYADALKWRDYFEGRSNFGPYDGMVNAIGQLLKASLDRQQKQNQATKPEIKLKPDLKTQPELKQKPNLPAK